MGKNVIQEKTADSGVRDSSPLPPPGPTDPPAGCGGEAPPGAHPGMSGSVEIWQVDAFTTRPFGGNPAGVVLDAGGLSDAEMWKIAAEMNVPATAFVAPATRPAHDLKLRWFTPSGKELAFCGHATVATAHLLAETGRLSRDRVVFDTLGGALSVTVSPTPDGILIWLEPPLPACAPPPPTLRPVLDAPQGR